MPLPLIPLITAGATIGSTAIQTASKARQAKKERKANREMAKYAYSKDLEQWNRQNVYNRQMWDLQNLYNAPAQQMQRIRESGLNPNLMYQQGSTGQAGSVGQAEMSKYTASRQEYNAPIEALSALGMFNDFRMKNAQVDNLQQINKTEHARTWGQWLENTIKENKARKQGIDLGELKGFEESPYYRQAQAQTKQAEANAIMKTLEANWWKASQGTRIGGTLARIIKMVLSK